MQDFSVGCLSIAAITAKMSEQLDRIGSDRHGSARNGTVHRENSMETNGRSRTASDRLDTDPFGTYRNSSGILERAKRSEGPKRAEG
jgi:hypothetical protein